MEERKRKDNKESEEEQSEKKKKKKSKNWKEFWIKLTISNKKKGHPGKKDQPREQKQEEDKEQPGEKGQGEEKQKKPNIWKKLEKYFSMFKKEKEQTGKEETSKKEEQPEKKEQPKIEEQPEKEKHPGEKAQKQPEKWKRQLAILNIITFIIILAGVVFLGYFVLKPEPLDTNVEQSTVDPEDDFFDSPAVYYIKTADMDDDSREYIESKMKSLKMDKESVEKFLNKKFLNKLDLAESSENSEDAKQYFFYKDNEATIYTSIKAKEEVKIISGPERIEIRILEAQNQNKYWGIFDLEKVLVENESNKFQYILKYIKGKFDKTAGKPRSYIHLELNLRRKSLDKIVEIFAGAIQETINKNPNDSLDNGEILEFKFLLFRESDNKKYIKLKESPLTFYLNAEKKSITKQNENGEVSQELKIVSISLDESKKASLEQDLKRVLTGFFSREVQPQKITKYEIFTYKDGKPFSAPADHSFKRINELLEKNEKNNSFQEWETIFSLEPDQIKLVNLIGYIENRSNNLKAEAKINWSLVKRKLFSLESIFLVTLIALVILIYFVIRDEINTKRRKEYLLDKWNKGEKLSSEELREIGVDKTRKIKEGISEMPVGKKIETETTITTDKEKEKTELFKRESVAFYSIEKKQSLLKEIQSSLTELQQIAIDSFGDTIDNKFDTPAEKEQAELNFGNLNIAERLVKEMLEIDDKETNQGIFDSKLRQLQKALKEFRKKNKNPKIDDYVGKIEKEFEKFEKSETPELLKEEPDSVIVTPDAIAERITNTNQRLSEMHRIITNNSNYLANFDELLGYIDKNIVTIINQFEYGHKLDQILSYLNRETDIYVTRENVLEIIEKVSSEEKTSKEYRLCGVNLYEDLFDLEKFHKDAWYWSLLAEGLLSKLRENIDFFSLKNEGARTIYDRYLKKGIPLRDIQREDIKKIIEQHHWVQIWDELIRMNDFFDAYFDDEMADIKPVLAYFSQKIKSIFKKLRYEITHTKPLCQISDKDRKSWESEQSDKKSFIFIEKSIIKNLVESGNKKFLEEVENIPKDREMVVYVERLGLVDKFPEKSITISKLRFGAYNRDILQSYISSWSGPVRGSRI